MSLRYQIVAVCARTFLLLCRGLGNALRVLAVMSEKRAATFSDVPTLIESGLSDFNVASWNAIAAPAKTPAQIIEKLNREINVAISAPQVQTRLRELHVEPKGGTPAQLGNLLKSEIKRWGSVIDAAGIAKQ